MDHGFKWLVIYPQIPWKISGKRWKPLTLAAFRIEAKVLILSGDGGKAEGPFVSLKILMMVFWIAFLLCLEVFEEKSFSKAMAKVLLADAFLAKAKMLFLLRDSFLPASLSQDLSAAIGNLLGGGSGGNGSFSFFGLHLAVTEAMVSFAFVSTKLAKPFMAKNGPLLCWCSCTGERSAWADLLQQVKCELKLWLEICVSQNLGKLRATSFPESSWWMSRRGPWERGWLRGWLIACKNLDGRVGRNKANWVA